MHRFVKTAFSAQHQHVLPFSHWAHHFFTLFSEVHGFVQNDKAAFSARDQHVLSFSHYAHHLLAIFSKLQEFVQNSVFSPRSARFVIFELGTPLFSFSKVHEFVQNSVFRTRSTRFVIFALGAPLFCDFQQSARVCTKQHFQKDISTFCHFRTGRTTS